MVEFLGKFTMRGKKELVYVLCEPDLLSKQFPIIIESTLSLLILAIVYIILCHKSTVRHSYGALSRMVDRHILPYHHYNNRKWHSIFNVNRSDLHLRLMRKA